MGPRIRLRHLRYFVVVAEMAAGKVLIVISVLRANILQPHGLFTTLFREELWRFAPTDDWRECAKDGHGSKERAYSSDS